MSMQANLRAKSGKGIAIWIWVLGAVIIGLVVFAIFFRFMVIMNESKQQQDAKSAYQKIIGSFNGYCSVRKGSAMTQKFDFSNIVQSIFASLDQKNPNIEGNVTTGKYVCINISSSVTCEKAYCDVEMALLQKKSQLLSDVDKVLGKVGNAQYTLRLEKTDCGVALIDPDTESICTTCDLARANIVIRCSDSTPVLLTYKDIVILTDVTPWIDVKDSMQKLVVNAANYLKSLKSSENPNEKILIAWEDDMTNPGAGGKQKFIKSLQGLGFDVTVRRHNVTFVDLAAYDQVWLINPGWCGFSGRSKASYCKGVKDWDYSEIADLKNLKLFVMTDTGTVKTKAENPSLNKILKAKGFDVLQLPECKCNCGKGWMDTKIIDHALTKDITEFKINAVASIGCE